ncbi:MAG: polysaccharide pyruvyl transferase family protein [Cyanobacteria bacterium P01_C01_bin.89]
MRIVLLGYYGWHNLGDDLFVEQLSRHLPKILPNLTRLTILCQKCYYQSPEPSVRFRAMGDLSKLQLLRLMVKADYVIWGGGSMEFGDVPKTMLLMQQTSQKTGGRFQFWGVGLEKIDVTDSSEGAIASTRLLKKSSFLYFRDPVSYTKASSFQPDHTKYCLGGDIALLDPNLYRPWHKLSAVDGTSAPTAPPKTIKNIGISGKFWWGQGRADFYGDQLRPWVDQHGATIHCLPAHGGTENSDNQFHEKLKTTLPEGTCVIHDWGHYGEFLQLLRLMDVYISNRLHGVITADQLGVPNIGIASESKITNYIQKSGMVPELRVVEFMDPITEDHLRSLVSQYRRPNEFIEAESQAAKGAIAQALNLKQ